jgi:D-glycero-alpha-D-manno-heptose-7-phosphate kinase
MNKCREGNASDTLNNIDDKLKEDDDYYLDNMRDVKLIGYKAKSFLENFNFDEFGKTLDEHWKLKKEWHQQTTNDLIESIYKDAMDLGAYGGKTIGAPGGGYIMFYHPSSDKGKWDLINKLEQDYNLVFTPIRFVD